MFKETELFKDDNEKIEFGKKKYNKLNKNKFNIIMNTNFLNYEQTSFSFFFWLVNYQIIYN